MSDPTVQILQYCFLGALGLFAATALVRRLRAGQAPATDGMATPPPVPVGKVATWPYRPMDFLMMGMIFLIFLGSSLSTAMSEPPTDIKPQVLAVSIGFQFFLLALVLITILPRVRPAEWLGLRWPHWKWLFLIGPATVVCMWVVLGGLQVAGYMEWIQSLGAEPMQDSVKLLQESKDPLVIILMATAAVIVAPVCEEVVFRGYLYPAMKKFSGPWVAGFCSALIFAAAHGNLAAVLPLFLLGAVFVLLYERTGSIWAPIAVHLCFNGATVAIQLLLRYHNIPLEAAS